MTDDFFFNDKNRALLDSECTVKTLNVYQVFSLDTCKVP